MDTGTDRRQNGSGADALLVDHTFRSIDDGALEAVNSVARRVVGGQYG